MQTITMIHVAAVKRNITCLCPFLKNKSTNIQTFDLRHWIKFNKPFLFNIIFAKRIVTNATYYLNPNSWKNVSIIWFKPCLTQRASKKNDFYFVFVSIYLNCYNILWERDYIPYYYIPRNYNEHVFFIKPDTYCH